MQRDAKAVPHVLVLEKTQDLFIHETQARKHAEQDLAWISETIG